LIEDDEKCILASEYPSRDESLAVSAKSQVNDAELQSFDPW